MAKRTPRSQADDATAAAEPQRKPRSPAKGRAAREVQSDMATGQDQAGAMSDEFIGVPNTAQEPVQGDTNGSTESSSMSSEPSEEDIRMRAYQRYMERGGTDGMDFEDWLEAERELKSRR